MKLALFDFDGTLTTKDSLADFIQHCVGKPAYYLGLTKLSPVLLTYMLKLTPNDKAKQQLISHFFKGHDIDTFQRQADTYSLHKIDKILRPKSIRKLRWHQQQGHHVVIVSASMESWLRTWCKKQKVDLIATKLEIKNSKLTGKFATRNCNGKEKVNRIKKKYQLDNYSTIYAYGDSSGDKEMLELTRL